MPILPVAEWKPDQSPLAGGTAIAEGVIPISEAAYGPLPSITALGSATVGPTAFTGGAVGENLLSPTAVTVIGENSTPALWWSANNGATWSKTILNTPWTVSYFTQFKNQMVATGSPSVPPYLLDLNALSGWSLASSGPNLPGGAFCATVNDFLMLGNTWDYTGGGAGVGTPYRVWWSGIGDPTNWPAPGSAAAQAVQADYNDFQQDYGVITGITGALSYSDGAIFFERAVVRVTYVGPPAIFDFQRIPGAKGCRASKSITRVGSVVYYFGEDGFYMLDGMQAVPIGVGRVDKWLPESTNGDWGTTYNNYLFGAYDANYRCIFWKTPRFTGPTSYSLCLVYSIPFNRFSYFVENAVGGTAVSSIFQGKLLTATFPANEYIDQAMFLNTSNLLATFSGTNMAATVSTIESQPIDGRRCFVRNVRPLTDGGAPSVAIYSRDRQIDAQAQGNPVAITSAGSCPQRVNARYVQAVITQPAGAAWNTVEGIEIPADGMAPGGLR